MAKKDDGSKGRAPEKPPALKPQPPKPQPPKVDRPSEVREREGRYTSLTRGEPGTIKAADPYSTDPRGKDDGGSKPGQTGGGAKEK